MQHLACKIRTLRKNKNLTQQQLADALSVSAQTVSKWETDLSVPDISLLPVIARYFGITIDDLFDYRLEALNYKERFVRFMVDNGMLRLGRFELQSGRVSPYHIHSGYYRAGRQIAKLGEFYAECIREHVLENHRLVGNTRREIPLVIAASMTLYSKYGVETGYCVDYTLPHDDGAGEMTLITDTFTSGNTLRGALAQIKAYTGKYPTDIVVSVDRMEKGIDSPVSARHAIEREFGVRIHSIVTLEDIIRAMENGVIAEAGVLGEIKAYRERYMGE